MGVIDWLKQLYYKAEDKYYEFLDRVNERIPIYELTDRIDKVFPSFLLFLLLLLLLFLLFLWLLWGFLFPFLNFDKEVRFVVLDDAGATLSGKKVDVLHDKAEETFTSDSFGEFKLTARDLNVLLQVKEPGYEPYSDERTVSASELNEIVLTGRPPVLFEKIIEVRNPEGNPIDGSSMRFTCSRNFAAPNPIRTAKSEERIFVSEYCGIVSVIVNKAGFQQAEKTLTAARTVIILQPIELPKATLRVVVRDIETNNGLPEITLGIYDDRNALKAQGMSDSSGAKIFSLEPGSYFVKARDNRDAPLYQNKDSGIISVEVDEETTVELLLSKLEGEAKQVLVKFIDKATKEPVKGVRTTLFEDSAEIVRKVSSSEGLVSFINVTPGREYAVTAVHQNYVFSLIQNLPVISRSSSNATVIELEKATSENSGNVIVSVKSLEGNAVDGAQVYLFMHDINFSVRTASTDSEGIVRFERMPLGFYHAAAEKQGERGNSETKALVAGSDLLLEIVLVLAEGFMEVEVVDVGNRPLEGAKVEFVDAVHGKQGEALTLANGKTEKISFKWNLRPYLVVSKEGFLPTTTVSYAILPRQTTKAKVVLRTTADLEDLKCDAENKLCVGLVGILSNDRTRRAVSSLTSNKGYVLLFEIVAGSDLNNVESVVRTGFEEELTAAESLVVIERPVAALASAVKFDTYDASDNYADLTPTNGDGKQAKFSFHDLNRGIYNYEVEVFIKNTDEENAEIQLRYGAKGDAATQHIVLPPAGLFLEIFFLDTPFPCDAVRADCYNFQWSFSLTNPDGRHFSGEIELTPEQVQIVRQEYSYELTATVFNQHQENRSFQNEEMTFESVDGAIEASPDSIPVTGFLHGTSYSTSVSLQPLVGSSSSDLRVSLNLNERDDTVQLRFMVPDQNKLALASRPSFITAGAPETILIIDVTDSVNGQAVAGALVQWDDSAEFSSPEPVFENSLLGAGSYTLTVPRREIGESVFVKAEKSFYQESDLLRIPVQPRDEITFRPEGFECVSLSDNSIDVLHNSSDTFTLTTHNCDLPVEVAMYVPAASFTLPSVDLAGPITLKEGSNIVGQCESCASTSLSENDSVIVKALGDKLLGQYDIYIRLRYEGDEEFRDFDVVEVSVKPVEEDIFVLEDDKAAYNIFGGTDEGTAINRKPIFIPDFWIPKVGFDLDARGRYFAAQDRFNDLGLVSFCWTVRAEIEESDEPPVNITETNCTEIFPEEGVVYELYQLSEEDFYLLRNIDAEEGDVLNIYAEDDSGGLIETMVEGTPETGLFVTAIYTGNVQDHEGIIDFTVVNEGLRGRDYSLLEVKDRVQAQDSEESVYEFTGLGFSYTIKSVSERETIIQNFSETVLATGEEVELGIIPESLRQGAEAEYLVSDDSEFVLVYFKDENGSPSIVTNNQNAVVYARAAFSLKPSNELDIVFLLDVSGSMGTPWRTICQRRQDLVDNLEEQGFDVNFEVFAMGVITRRSPCVDEVAEWADTEIPFVRGTDQINEAWAPTGLDVINNKFAWRENARKILLIIGDNSPGGSDESRWRPNGQGELMTQHLVEAAQDKNVSLYFFHPISMENRTAAKLINDMPIEGTRWKNECPGSNCKNDSIELMEYAAEWTGGLVETYESQENLEFALQNVNFFSLVLRGMTSPATEYFHVRLDSGKKNVCYGRNDIEGITGSEAIPRVLPSWNWDSVGIDSCDLLEFREGTARNNEFVYCDATQFTIELMKKLSELKQEVETSGNLNIADKLLHFDAFLMKDGFTSDFVSDFNSAMLNLGFFDTGNEFSNDFDGFKKLFLENNIHFDSTEHSVTPLPSAGLYEVQIKLKFGDAGNWVFFSDANSNVDVNVVLTRKQPLETENLIYSLPVDGVVGIDPVSGTVNRNGYGMGFSGETDALSLYRINESGDLRIGSSTGSPLGRIDLDERTDFASLNQEFRGNLLFIREEAVNRFSFVSTLSQPNPIVMEAYSNNGKAGAFFNLRDETGTPISDLAYLSLWTGIASDLSLCRDFSGEHVFRKRKDSKLSTAIVSADACNSVDVDSTYGFYWSDAVDGSVYLRTMFFTPNNNYSFRNACQNRLTRIVAVNEEITSTTPLILNSGSTKQVFSLADIFDLIEQEYVCVSTRVDSGKKVTDFWWNEDKLFEELEQSKGEFFCNLTMCSALQINC